MFWFVFSRLLLLFAGGLCGLAVVLFLIFFVPEPLQVALNTIGKLPDLIRSWGASEEVILVIRLLIGPVGMLLAISVGFFQSVIALWLGLWGSLIRVILGHATGVIFALCVTIKLTGWFNALSEILDPISMQAVMALGVPSQYSLLIAGMISGAHLAFVILVLTGQVAVVLVLLFISALLRQYRCSTCPQQSE